MLLGKSQLFLVPQLFFVLGPMIFSHGFCDPIPWRRSSPRSRGGRFRESTAETLEGCRAGAFYKWRNWWEWSSAALKIVGAILWDKRIEPGMVQIPNGEPVRPRWPHNLKGRLLLDADMGLEQHMNCGCFSGRSPFYWPGGFSSLGETVLPTLLIKIVDWVAMSCHVAKKYAFHSGVSKWCISLSPPIFWSFRW